ncbi:MAG TPA: hypothetical protein VN131_02555 [Mobilitalea sp.]|nr:hypothetical protein [Mobilitalea sp.]
MGDQFYYSGGTSGFQYEKHNNIKREDINSNTPVRKNSRRDDDLIIEDNTVYEIDRECYERLRRQKKKK